MSVNLLEALNLSPGQVFTLETSALPSGALRLQAVEPPMPDLVLGVTALTTVGNGTITAAGLLSGAIARSGPTGAFTDTTDTAAAIQSDWAGGAVDSSFDFTYINNTAFNVTLAGGSGVSPITGDLIVPANSSAVYRMIWTGSDTISMTQLSLTSLESLPAAKYTSINATVGTLAAGNITGADRVFLVSTNATPGAQTTRTATQMFADTPNAKIGQTWTVRIQNTGAGTFTLTADASVTLGGTAHAAILTNTWVDYVCTFTSGTAMTMNAVGSGVSP